jgi:hypothetical protein
MERNPDHEGNSRFRPDLAARLFSQQRPWFPAVMRHGAGRPSKPARRFVKTSARPAPEPFPLDVICAGMYRACSTWQYEVIAHLIERAYDGRRLGYLTVEQYTSLLETDAENGPSAPGTRRIWRAVKSHEGDRSFSRALAQGRALAVYAYRDVRDVVFSLMHKRGVTFEQLLRQGMIQQILANDRFWMRQPDAMIQRYEDLLADPVGGVKELARHVGVVLDESEAAQIATLYSPESNRARAEALRRRLEEAGLDLNSASNLQICDPKTLLHWNHMRQGQSGSWRSSATPSQRAMLNRLCGRWLKARGYSVDPIESPRKELSLRALRERIRGEANLWTGRAAFLIRARSQRFPATARTIKRLLGMPTGTAVGATAWADAVPSNPSTGRQTEASRRS